MNTATLGQFVLDTARSAEKNKKFPEQQAAQVRDLLTERMNEKIEELRALQRRAYEDSKSVTVF
ncbi:MAG TPA: hypothetical protein VF522_04010 [Ramlibacter sp.]|uniref:hypothetical protein n=1 Tax=Ramlibacter sp. TaxID=1917967 RepID=UPI002ED381C6